MTKHPHYDLIVEWAKDTSRVVQWYSAELDTWLDRPITDGNWYADAKYRFKPKPKPDVVEELIVRQRGRLLKPEYWQRPNCRFVFDGETGNLKAAEVLL